MFNKTQLKLNQRSYSTGQSQLFKSGSALLLTMFILSGMLIVAISGAYIIVLGIRAGSIQSQSTMAYFAAESGAEQLLYTVRKSWDEEMKEDFEYGDDVYGRGFDLAPGLSYNVYYMTIPSQPATFSSIGIYKDTKRSVELQFSGL